MKHLTATIMKLILFILTISLAGVLYTPIIAQFTLSGEFRPRTEFRHGFQSLADSNQHYALFTDQRTRLNFDFKTETYEVKLAIQDVRVWGATSQLNTTDAFTSVHEAWGNVYLNKMWSFKFGRQEINCDDHRILGNVDWAQHARSHDAAMFKFKKDGMQLDALFAFNQDAAQSNTTNYTVPKNYKSMQYVWFHKDFAKSIQVSILALNNGKQVTNVGNASYHTNYTQTFGTHTKFKKNKFDAAFNGYYQMGSMNTLPAKKLNAYLIGLDLNYKLTEKFTATLGGELQSGNNQTDTSKAYTNIQHAFSPLYGTNHKFNGFMDYFYVGNWEGSVGLQDIFVKFNYTNEKSFIGLDAHIFSAVGSVWNVYAYSDELLGGNLTPTYKEMSKTLGAEFDLYFGRPIAKGVLFKGGFSMMLGTETLAHLNGIIRSGKPYNDAINAWAYAMIIIKPTFFTTEK